MECLYFSNCPILYTENKDTFETKNLHRIVLFICKKIQECGEISSLKCTCTVNTGVTCGNATHVVMPNWQNITGWP